MAFFPSVRILVLALGVVLQTATIGRPLLGAEVVLIRLVPQLAQDWPQLAPDPSCFGVVNHLALEAQDVIVEDVWRRMDRKLCVRVFYPLDIHAASHRWYLWLLFHLESPALLLTFPVLW